jgi:hypothetical protein
VADATPTFERHATRASARVRIGVLHRRPERFVGFYDLDAEGMELDLRFTLGRVEVRS